MPVTTEYPTLDVATPYGVLTLTFLDPTEEPGSSGPTYGPNVGSIYGALVINRVPVRISTRLSYWKRTHRNGVDIDPPELELMQDYANSYNRRGTLDSWNVGDLPDGVRRKIAELINGVVRGAYEAHPELQLRAKRARLAIDYERAESEAGEKYKEFVKLLHAAAECEAKLVAFEVAHPETTAEEAAVEA